MLRPWASTSFSNSVCFFKLANEEKRWMLSLESANQWVL